MQHVRVSIPLSHERGTSIQRTKMPLEFEELIKSTLGVHLMRLLTSRGLGFLRRSLEQSQRL